MNLKFWSKYLNKSVDGKKIFLRRNSIDHEVFEYVFVEKYHRPFKEITTSKPVILDLGTNIGLTVIDFKNICPGAIIYGYEMDIENFELAKKNCKNLADVYLFNNAVWFEESILKYDKSVNVDAYKIDTNIKNEQNTIEVKTISIDNIIEEHKLKSIDYIKMDIEGAEYNIFQNGLEWLKRTKQLKIEVHFGEDIFKFIDEKLKQYGFKTMKDTHHWSTIIGYRDES
jgi:FkbM family methyltransferase